MKTKILALWLGACMSGMAKPGDLDPNFDPELRAWVTPDHVTIAADGRAWVGGGFDRGDSYSTGDLVRLGENGGVESEPAAGYLERNPDFTYREVLGGPATQGATAAFGFRLVKAPPAAPVLLASGDFLLPTPSLSWLRMSATGEVIGRAFPDRRFGETITPQFERDGRLWVIREFSSGKRILERRNSADGSVDPGFSQGANLPTNVNGVVPGAAGSVWATAGDGFSKYLDSFKAFPDFVTVAEQHQLYQVDATGKQIGSGRMLKSYREPRLVTGPNGAFRVIYGLDQSRFAYSAEAFYGTYVVDWFSPTGAFERTRNFSLYSPLTFLWTETADGSYLATHYTGRTQKFRSNGVIDRTFPSPGRNRSVKALAGGKWLIDGTRRINADGSEDPTWSVPELHVPAEVTTLVPLANGRVLVGGNFAMAEGIVSNRLVIFFANGQIDHSFVPDDRIGEWRSVAVSGQAIYVVTSELISYGNRIRSKLLKLRMDGTLDETYDPTLPTTSWIGNSSLPSPIFIARPNPNPLTPIFPGSVNWPIFTSPAVKLPNEDISKVHALPRGHILVETFSLGDVPNRTISRLHPNGSYDPGFQNIDNDPSFAPLLVRADGGFVISGVIYRPNGTVERDLSSPDIVLAPLCEFAGGILFQESKGELPRVNLRLWTRRGWANAFKAPVFGRVVSATSGDYGMLYLNANLLGSTQTLVRLLPNGRIDNTFRPPVFGKRKRQFAGDWWRAEEFGKTIYDPAQDEFLRFPQTMIWHPASRSLWTGGDFNMVNGQPRDGLAQISGGFSWWPWR